MIEAKIIADSVDGTGNSPARITTFQLTYPRFIHSELMTHRVFSRNASSSRAIPVKRLVDMALENPAFFSHVGKNKPGMQAAEEVDEETKERFRLEWEELAGICASYALRWSDPKGMNIHKQVVNRVLEPWHHIAVVVTSTEWNNFWELRCHNDAQPEIKALADVMMYEYDHSTITSLDAYEWHLPYVEEGSLPLHLAVKASVARCARVSYMNHDGSSPDLDKDIALYNSLVKQEPAHLSPTEHQARFKLPEEVTQHLSGNFHSSVIQHRKLLETIKGIM